MSAPRIHVYSAPAEAFFVNSFLIEGADGVVAVDTQFLVSSATALRKQLDTFMKPLAAVIITHPHPDHYNGLPVLLDGLAPVAIYATQSTIDGISATQASKRAAWTPIYGDDYHFLTSNGNTFSPSENLSPLTRTTAHWTMPP